MERHSGAMHSGEKSEQIADGNNGVISQQICSSSITIITTDCPTTQRIGQLARLLLFTLQSSTCVTLRIRFGPLRPSRVQYSDPTWTCSISQQQKWFTIFFAICALFVKIQLQIWLVEANGKWEVCAADATDSRKFDAGNEDVFLI